MQAQLEVLLLLSEGMGVNAVCRAKGVKAETVNRWMLKAAAHVREVTVYLEKGTRLTQSEGSPVKLMSFGRLSIKKANLRKEDQEREDRWGFVNVLPDSGFIHTIHNGPRNQGNFLHPNSVVQYRLPFYCKI